MAEGGALLRRYTGLNRYRGFESLSLRHFPMRVLIALAACAPLLLGCEALDEWMGASRQNRCGHVDWRELGLRDGVTGAVDGSGRLQEICGEMFQPEPYQEGLLEGRGRRPGPPV